MADISQLKVGTTTYDIKGLKLRNLYTSRQTSMNFNLQNEHNVFYTIASSATTEGKPPVDAGILTLPWDNSGWGGQIAIGNNSNPNLYIRGATNDNGASVWDASWKTVLDSNNYTTYAAAKNHNHDSNYVNVTGDTMTGELKITSTTGGSSSGLTIEDTNGGGSRKIAVMVGTGHTNGGLYDTTNSKWIIYSTGTQAKSELPIYGAVWNDYAEFRKTTEAQPGQCVREVGDGSLVLTTKRLEKGCEIVSDTYGFAIGESDDCKTPIATAGRVLAYPYESIEEFKNHIGDPVCSGPDGTVSIMTEEEEEKYPSRIIGTISEIPTYETWGTGNVEVDGRVWIRIR